MDLSQQDLAGKTVLEVGSGRGGTTRRLADLLAPHPGARLIVTDISDAHFPELREELHGGPLGVEFLRTDACELAGVDNHSVDYLVCSYTLCAINAQPGRAALALQRFQQVLRPGSWLLVQEELPIDRAGTPAQEVWAAKWRILKAATIVAGGSPFAEFAPETLAGLCRLAGLSHVEWEADSELLTGSDVLAFFQRRLDMLLPRLPNDALRAGFECWARELWERAASAGGMEVPYYRLAAHRAGEGD
jgi:SAM-dependent methyltransferase